MLIPISNIIFLMKTLKKLFCKEKAAQKDERLFLCSFYLNVCLFFIFYP